MTAQLLLDSKYGIQQALLGQLILICFDLVMSVQRFVSS